MTNIFQIEAGSMSWDEHEGWCIEIKLLGLIFQVAIGRREKPIPVRLEDL